jgi:hypothetical protein
VTGEAQAARPAYEELRGHVLAGRSVAGDAAGLLLLVREGLAAWIERCPAGGAPAAPIPAGARPAAVPLATEGLHASLVRLLARMAMAHGDERSQR